VTRWARGFVPRGGGAVHSPVGKGARWQPCSVAAAGTFGQTMICHRRRGTQNGTKINDG
jgi:hypothetical protein